MTAEAVANEPWVDLHVGDCLDVLAGMPDASVHCCVTSPPYYGLRDYGVEGQIGLEESPNAYVERLVAVFREVRRVLHPSGTLWLNLGDSYANDVKGSNGKPGQGMKGVANQPAIQKNWRTDGVKKKDLLGTPWRVAFALQADGWYLRQDIIWSKPNPMPESVRDRCTKAHEYVFLLSKSASYHFDAEAIKEVAVTAGAPAERVTAGKAAREDQGERVRTRPVGRNCGSPDRRNKRSVWTVTPKPFKGSHFAVMPPGLVEPCVLAGCPKESCPACGEPYRRRVERTRVATRPGTDTKVTGDPMTDGNRDPQRHVTTTETVGWEPGCVCEAGDPIPGVVIDPFGGAGTTAVVAHGLGRSCVLIELNPEYADIIQVRLAEPG